MTEVEFGRLVDLAPRDAWRNEERDFTPWLAENIVQLGEAIGIPLELTGTEVRVERFEADILARNPMDDTIVLIENQLEPTDHTHLGQIMTYLAGLNAHTVVWIAPTFREPHLSAIRWLNEHTAEGFSFFGVKVRVVRIGDSPFAPIFEVLEKPNGWERRLIASRTAAQGGSAIGDARAAYWRAYVQRHPATRVPAGRGGWIAFTPEGAPFVRVAIWIGQKEAGIFIRPASPLTLDQFSRWFDPLVRQLEERLGCADRKGDGTRFSYRIDASLGDPATWPKAQDWQEQQLERYLAAISDIARTVPPPPAGDISEAE